MRDAAYAHAAPVSALVIALASSTGCALRSSGAAMPVEASAEGARGPAAAYAEDSTSAGRRSAAANDDDSAADAVGDSLGIDLPPGDGRTLVIEACTPCHDLGGVAAFKGYWNRERWASMVATMIEHGAELDEREADLVVDYLTAHFGDGTTPASRERAGAAMERHQNGGLTQ